MDFILFHQHKKPVLVKIDAIQMVYPSAKGLGSFIVTNIEGNDLEVDERHYEVLERLQEMEVEIVEFAND